MEVSNISYLSKYILVELMEVTIIQNILEDLSKYNNLVELMEVSTINISDDLS
jgi:hypothetical protein